MKKVYIFNHPVTPYLQGYTLDQTGANLPKVFDAQWQFFKTVYMEKESKLIGISSKVVLAAIENEGYYIKQTDIKYK